MFHVRARKLFLTSLLCVPIASCALPMRSYDNPQLRQQFEQEFSTRPLDPIEGFWRSANEHVEGIGVIYRTDPSGNDGFPFAGRTISAYPKQRLPYSPDFVRIGARYKPASEPGVYLGQMLMVQGAHHFWKDATVRLLNPTTLECSVLTNKPVLGGSTQRAYLVGPDRVLKSRLAMMQRSSSETGPLPEISGGTGFLISRSHALTNHHVVEGASGIECFVDSVPIRAKCIASDPDIDVALLELATPCVPGIEPFLIASSSEARQGQTVFAMGYQLTDVLGTKLSVHDGIISSLTGADARSSQFQVEMSVHPGSSGGPLIDEYGSVIGIVTSKLGIGYFLNTGDIPQGIMFAIKSDWLQPMLDDARIPERMGSVETSATALSLDRLAAKYALSVVRIEVTR